MRSGRHFEFSFFLVAERVLLTLAPEATQTRAMDASLLRLCAFARCPDFFYPNNRCVGISLFKSLFPPSIEHVHHTKAEEAY